MQRLLCALVAMMALAVSAGAGTALAGGVQPDIGSGGPQTGQSGQSSQSSRQDGSVSNSTDQNANQSNATLNLPINVALLNGGGVNQSNGGVDESNGNANVTSQGVSQSEGSTQSGSGPGQGDSSGSGSPQPYGAAQNAVPQGGGSQDGQSSDQSESVSNTAMQDASQGNLVVNVPVNAAIANGGGKPECGCQAASGWGSKGGSPSGVDQSNGGVQESNGNLNATSQDVRQSETSSQQSSGGAAGGDYGKGPAGGSGQSSDQNENVSNHTDQHAAQHNAVVNVPINVAALNTGGVDQRNGGVGESNGNANATSQLVSQDESSSQTSGSGKSRDGGWSKSGSSSDTGSQSSRQHESVSNTTDQTATQSDLVGSVPVNVALLNGGGSGCRCDGGKGGVYQPNGGVDEMNGNANATGQYVWQGESSTDRSTQSSSSDHGHPKGDCSCTGSKDRTDGATHSQRSYQHESVSNSTDQSAQQHDLTGNVPVNAALLNSGGSGGKWTFGKQGVSQQNGGVDESNRNVNTTKQKVHQDESSSQSTKGDEGDRGTRCPKHESSCRSDRCKPNHCKRPNRERCPQVK